MDHITRLLMQAKRAKNGKGMHIIGFVHYDNSKGKYTASGSIWDGVMGSGGESFYSEHDTKEEAITACEDVAAQYPNSEDIIFYVDYGLGA